ncbi:hypothetical protein EDEG_00472 [Edhazardia aedis USNM 41457]|uniref:DNA-directed RNA polymerase I, II, and III subunit RPABC2 n=1 Tax=Edhazardia aedis (strain USNM 41457) TaxID=1003232 RepID=J9DIY6_EDHAE|nr:hypothetical protein EDEG_00472 [Edhazardia aedis USNM 41457]|eukprot:EJW01347.1 hypothetical protein EDEG_00472 [Edhazardia aedis USNM 41457]
MEFESSSSSENEIPNIEIFEEPAQAEFKKTVKNITSNRMTKYEKAHILGIRALQISMGAPPLVDIEYETDPLKIALMELNQKKMPFQLRRRLPDASYEEWDINEMIIPYD